MFEPTAIYAPNPHRYDTMTYNRAGTSGLKLPAVSLGFWHNFGDITPFDQMKSLVFTAFDNGITHFDLANNYGPEPGQAEKNCGLLLAKYFKHHRDELVISTKAGYEMWTGPYGDLGSRKYLLASLDQSLERLGLDYVDIFYHHHPDPETPLEETMGALAQAVNSGKALYVGLSNYDGPTMEKAAAILAELHVPFIINQNKYNILDRTVEKNGLKETAFKLGKGLITFCPLAQGLLTNRYLNGIPADSRMAHDPRFLNDSALTEKLHKQVMDLNNLAAERGQTLAEMSLAWLLHDGKVTSVLTGASKPQQILDNIGRAEEHPLQRRGAQADRRDFGSVTILAPLAEGSQVPPLARHFLINPLAVGANRVLGRVVLGDPNLTAQGDHRTTGRTRFSDTVLGYVVRKTIGVATIVTNRRLLGLRTLQHRRAGTLVRVAQRFGIINEHLGKSHGALLSSYSTIRLHSIIDSRRYPRNPVARNPHTSTHPCRASRHPATYNATYNAAHDATPTPHTAPHALPHTPTRQQCTLGSTKHTTSGRL